MSCHVMSLAAHIEGTNANLRQREAYETDYAQLKVKFNTVCRPEIRNLLNIHWCSVITVVTARLAIKILYTLLDNRIMN